VRLRLAYLGVRNAFAFLRLLPMSDRDKDVEILALRHQLSVLHRQLGTEKVQFDSSDRAFLAALLHLLQRTPAAPRHRERSTTVPAAHADR
jgi:putative transposase